MGFAVESVLGFNGSLTGSTTFDDLTAGSGNSFTVRSYVDGTKAWLEDVWGSNDTSATQLSIRSPRMHDTTKGILLTWTNQLANAADAAVAQSLLPGYLTQQLYSTDNLTVQANGTAGDKVCCLFNVRYENLGGVEARLATWDQVNGSYDNLVGILTQPITSGTAGQWGAGVALNAVDNRLHADTDYAVLGYSSAETFTAFSIQGVDVGNLRVGGPGFWDTRDGGDFFVQQSLRYNNTGHIPIINSNNASGTYVAIADTATTNTVNTTVIMAQLRQKFTG